MSRAWLSDGWRRDGYPHERDETGFCGNCGARRGEAHYRLVPRTRIEITGNLVVHHPVKLSAVAA